LIAFPDIKIKIINSKEYRITLKVQIIWKF
jgi:hypothetical protein